MQFSCIRIYSWTYVYLQVKLHCLLTAYTFHVGSALATTVCTHVTDHPCDSIMCNALSRHIMETKYGRLCTLHTHHGLVSICPVYKVLCTPICKACCGTHSSFNPHICRLVARRLQCLRHTCGVNIAYIMQLYASCMTV